VFLLCCLSSAVSVYAEGERGKDGGEGWGDEREVAEFCLGRVPDLDRVCVLADEVLQVDCEGAAVAFEAGPRGVDALRDVEDDRGEAVLVDVDFLSVGDLADLAGGGD
jgi:hypothetical protein